MGMLQISSECLQSTEVRLGAIDCFSTLQIWITNIYRLVAPGDTTQALTRCCRRLLRVGGFENIFF